MTSPPETPFAPRPAVYIVQNDRRKDFSDARRFGQLKDVFGNVGAHYDVPYMLQHARRVLRNWQPGDHLLLVGDPTLCGVAMVIIAEQHGVMDVLRWDRVRYQYTAQRWDFDGLGLYEDSPLNPGDEIDPQPEAA